jgi:hypothetical protein
MVRCYRTCSPCYGAEPIIPRKFGTARGSPSPTFALSKTRIDDQS